MSGPAPTLEQLAARASRGDRAALRAIYEQTAGRLAHEVIGPLLRDRAACEDALKETFLSAIERLPALGQGEVYPWLATIARNKALDRLRRMGTEGRHRAALEAELGGADTRDPEREALAGEERALARRRVDEVLAAMSPRYAEAMRLRLLEELPRERCAERLGIKLGNFDVLVFRACKQFRALYVEKYGARAEVS